MGLVRDENHAAARPSAPHAPAETPGAPPWPQRRCAERPASSSRIVTPSHVRQRQYGWRYAKRPGVTSFLQRLAPHSELVMWTESMNTVHRRPHQARLSRPLSLASALLSSLCSTLRRQLDGSCMSMAVWSLALSAGGDAARP